MSSYGDKIRFLFVTAGAQRSGKTTFWENYAERYQQAIGPVVVYNPGRDTDFKDYEILRFLPREEVLDHERIPYYKKERTQAQAKRRIDIMKSSCFEMFEIGGRVYRAKDINSVLFHHRKVKVYRIEPRDEGKFYKTILMYLGGALLINDDFRGISRNFSDPRMGSLSELFSKLNHAGKFATWKPQRLGVDCVCMFHHPDKVNAEIYDYASHILLFNINRDINGRTVDNDDATEAMRKALKKLKGELPRYSAVRIDLDGPECYQLKIIKPLKFTNQ